MTDRQRFSCYLKSLIIAILNSLDRGKWARELQYC
jgi:hypothetical protein